MTDSSPTTEAEWAERTLRAMFDAHVRVNGPSCEREHELLTAALGWARDEGRREAVRIDPEVLAAAIFNCDLSHPVTFHVETVDVEAARIAAEYDRVAGLNASESPPTPRLDKQRLALAVQTVHDYDDDYEAVEEADEIAAAYAGDASESGQPPEASDE